MKDIVGVGVFTIIVSAFIVGYIHTPTENERIKNGATKSCKQTCTDSGTESFSVHKYNNDCECIFIKGAYKNEVN